MTLYTVTGVVPAGQTIGGVSYQHGKAGIQWLVYQISVATQPFRAGATASVFINNSYRTSTKYGGNDSAAGAPAWVLNDVDLIAVAWANVMGGDELILNLLYEEVLWGDYGSGVGLV